MSTNEVKTADVLDMLATGRTPLDIARKHDVSEWRIRTLIRESGTKFRAGPKSRVDDDRLRELVEQRHSLREMAKEFGIVPSTVMTHMRRLGLKARSRAEAVREGLNRGVGGAVLNAAGVEKLREDRRRGFSHKEAGKRVGISKSAAVAAADGETWGHIPIPVCTHIGGANA